MDSSRVKLVAIPLLIACLIPVVYRVSVSFLSSSEGVPVRALSEWSTRLAKYEQETATYGGRVQDLELLLRSVESRLEEVEHFVQVAERDKTKKLEEEAETSPIKLKYDIDDTGWKIMAIASASVQLIITILVIVLCVKVKRLKLNQESVDTPQHEHVETNCIDKTISNSEENLENNT